MKRGSAPSTTPADHLLAQEAELPSELVDRLKVGKRPWLGLKTTRRQHLIERLLAGNELLN